MQALHSTNLGVCQCWVQNGADFYNQFVVGQACGASNASQYVTTLWDRPHLPSLSICPTFAPSLNLGLYRYPCSSYVFCEQCLSVYCMNVLGRPSLLTLCCCSWIISPLFIYSVSRTRCSHHFRASARSYNQVPARRDKRNGALHTTKHGQSLEPARSGVQRPCW